ncbi:MAG TPA: phospholipase D-like domain-containing protein [Xanthobacteraceae bacterium]|nr:phospholipase D-like domain-containing protein [Xanthobacteraceae bacterium]
MSIDLKVYDNGDHTCLVWLPGDGKPIPNCRGFTIHRLLKPDATKPAQESYLHGFVGFSDTDKLDPNAMWKFPLQRFMWWDYLVQPGNVVQYSVVPVVGPDKDHLSLSTANAGAQTPPMTISGQASASISAYFNKGIVSAQWVSRALAALPKTPKPNLATLIGTVNNPLRNELSGLLRPQLMALLDQVKANNGQIYAALYELNDPELIQRLLALGQKCHLILANGAFKPPTNDENAKVRAQLHGKIDLHDRLVTSGHFAHNKFVVACDSAGNPQKVLSGSTNWTVTGLCTQANNSIIVNDAKLGADFINEWNLLKAAGNAYPPSLMQANSTSKSFQVDGGTITQWFVPTSAGQDLDYARTLINSAQQGILFLFFNPGVFEPDNQPELWTLLQNILARHQQGPNYNAGLYIHGVVNQEIAGLTTEGTGKPSKHKAADPTKAAPVQLYSNGNTAPLAVPAESMVPAAIKNTFHDWAAEVMNQGVHVHSKVIVIDPFGKKPVVMTGSHNLGHKASTANDDNLMIVEGNAPLAAAYAANIIAIYQTYRWNTYVDAHAKDPQVWHGLVDNATWQTSYLTAGSPDLAEIEFWLGQGASAPAAAGQPVPAAPPGGTKVRAATATGRAKKAAPKSAEKHPKKPAKKTAKKPAAHKHKVKRAAAHQKTAKKRSAVPKRKPAKHR